jgi:tRNA-dihydrouridine synthase A
METPKSQQEYDSKLSTKDGRAREYFAVAPMVDVSDKYQRYLMRHFTKRAFLYTEMINENAVLHSD